VFNNKKIFSVAGYLQVYQYSPFIVISIACGELRPVYGDMFIVGGYNEEYFFST
jgi:hypothetical protein